MSDLEAELMARYCDGDATAFRELYARVAPRLTAFLLRMTGDRPLADDLLQQTFLKVHGARATYVRGAAPLPWLYAIAHRTCLDALRQRKRARVRVARTDTVPEVPADIGGRRDGAANDPNPERAALANAAIAALESLPPNQREAVVLTKLSGKSVAEAAAIAGTTPGAMKVRAHRGYTALRKQLARGAGT